MFEKETQEIMQARHELAEALRQRVWIKKSVVEKFIKEADADECLWLIRELIDRVSTITGVAPELEDAADSLERFIEADGRLL